MFTGIIERTGKVREIRPNGSGRDLRVQSSLAEELKPDQSVAHNGVCLTVVSVDPGGYWVTAVKETLEKTTLGEWRTDEVVNLERSLRVGGRLDGHFVQGHVDTTGQCLSIRDQEGSWRFRFTFPAEFAPYVIEKGSVCVDGVSLTCFDVGRTELSVAVIPYTFSHTRLNLLRPGQKVNLEFDVLGKYFLRSRELHQKP